MSVDFKKNGVATAASFGSAAAPLQEMEIKSLDDGSVWACINYLDVRSNGEFFTDDAEVMKCVDKANRFSRMGIVDTFKQSNGTYEFMLTYPNLSSTDYNRWSQTSSPNATTGTGFTIISATWSTYMGPLRKTNVLKAPYSCDAGSSYGSWCGCIGQQAFLDPERGVYMATPSGAFTSAVGLWVRIDQLPETSICQIFDNSITATSFIEI